jgi:hypothetical protein
MNAVNIWGASLGADWPSIGVRNQCRNFARQFCKRLALPCD